MDDFDRIEADREANEHVAYEEFWARRIRDDDEADDEEEDA